MTFTPPSTGPFLAKTSRQPIALHDDLRLSVEELHTNHHDLHAVPLHVFPPLYRGETGGEGPQTTRKEPPVTIDYSPTYASARKGDRTLYVVESTRKHDRLVSVSLGKVTYNPTDPHDWYGIEPLVVIRAKDLPQLIAELSALYADRHAPLVCPF